MGPGGGCDAYVIDVASGYGSKLGYRPPMDKLTAPPCGSLDLIR